MLEIVSHMTPLRLEFMHAQHVMTSPNVCELNATVCEGSNVCVLMSFSFVHYRQTRLKSHSSFSWS